MAKKNLINADMLLASPKPQQQPPLSMPAPMPAAEPLPEPPPAPEPPIAVAETGAAGSTVKRGLKPDETRATFILNEVLLEKLKAVAYWDRRNIKEVMNEALERYIGAYEKQNGEIKPLP